MSPVVISAAFVDELNAIGKEKIAITRSVQEWRRASATGDQAGANQIAQGAGQLGLKPRYLENISGGGMEAGVDKMMGRSQMGSAENQSGLIARKVYKPDSPIATGQNMSNLLQQKQEMTNTARGISPQAKQMVPEMMGHQQIQGPGGQVRNLSEHEYVPNAKSLHSSPAGVAHAQRVQRTVAAPMAAQGQGMGDIARVHEGQLAGNVSNVAMTPKGPKVMDFLPEQFGGGKGGVFQKGQHDLAYSQGLGSGRMDTGYDKSNMNQLRKDVYRPQANYQPPALPGESTPAPPSGNPTKVERAPAPASTPSRMAATNIGGRPTPPAPTGGVTSPATMAKTQVAAPSPMQGALKGVHVPQTAMHLPTAGTQLAAHVPTGGIGKAIGGAVGQVAKAPGLKRLAMGGVHL